LEGFPKLQNIGKLDRLEKLKMEGLNA